MAVGWTRDGGVQDQIDASVAEKVELARRQIPEGESLTHCERCQAPIPEERRQAIPGVHLCVPCQSGSERARVATG